MYYKKLIQRKKLIRFWIFVGNNINRVFHINYQFLNILYNKYCFVHFKTLLVGIKNILSVFINILKSNNNLLFISTKFLYCQSIYKDFYFPIIKKIIYFKAGIFTNFSVTNFKTFKMLDFYFNPCLIIFFYLKKNILLLLESKKKKIPTVSLLPLQINSLYIDYPLFINSSYFYIIFFFSKFFFKLLFLIK